MNSILQDLRLAVRQLRRKPFFSLTVMLTLARRYFAGSNPVGQRLAANNS
jgi:hypothetical protein